MLPVHCYTDRFGRMSSTVDGSAWFDQASEEDIMDFLDGRWEGNTGSSIAAFDFLEFYKDSSLLAIDSHLTRHADRDIDLKLAVDAEVGMAWFEENRPEIYEALVRSNQNVFSYA
jgi:hypothetical protein